MYFLFVAVFLAAVTSSFPTSSLKRSEDDQTTLEERAACSNPLVRREWRTLSIPERKTYIKAVLCLTEKPSKAPSGSAPGARHRYDDFNAVHITKSDGLIQGTGGVHMVGSFLPWHRYFVSAFENALREECGYTGGLPYWNWSIDADSGAPLEEWEIYNPIYGFGGNGPYEEVQPVTASWPYMAGQTGGGCVSDGPFQNVTMNVGPGLILEHNPHCIHRGLNPDTVQYLKSEKTAYALEASSFEEFELRMEGPQDILPEDGIKLFHGSGHFVHGGDSTDFISSTTEPVFWLHHAYIDYLYWQWQTKNLTSRLSEVGGVRIPFHPESAPVSLTDTLSILWEAPDVTIADVMDIRTDTLCYEYA